MVYQPMVDISTVLAGIEQASPTLKKEEVMLMLNILALVAVLLALVIVLIIVA
jgi:hypothetical protein